LSLLYGRPYKTVIGYAVVGWWGGGSGGSK
jgi:hypothetical protein